MRFLAFDTALAGASRAARRFPAVVAAALVTAGAAVALIESRAITRRDELEILLSSLLGIPVFTALTLVGERLGRPGRPNRLPLLGGLAAILLFYLLVREAPEDQIWVRFLHWALAGHLAVAVGPFLATGTPKAFWQFNRLILQRFLLAAVYSLVLFLGLALALGAIDRLLGFSIPGDTYPELFAILGFGFNTWFFLAGVPDDLDRLEQLDDFPLGLKIFAQYVLVPLATVYLVIVVLYLGRVVITRTWPSGWIGYLVSGVSVTGTLAILLIHPVRDRAPYRWVDGYARWYFVSLIPALVMALLAVGKRIGQYGVTEPRYTLVVLAGWLLLLALYYAASRSRSIRLIPASLLLVAVLTAFGPWGMLSFSRRSQIDRLDGILARNGMTRPGGARPAPSDLAPLDAREIGAILRYLEDRHGAAVMARAAGVPADSAESWPADGEGVRLALGRLGVPEGLAVMSDNPWRMFNLYGGADTTVTAGIEIDGGGRVFVQRSLATPVRLAIAGDTLELRPDRAAGSVGLWRGDSLLVSLDVAGALTPALRDPADPELARRGRPEPIVVTGEGDRYRIRLLLTEASWSIRPADSLSRTVTATIIVSPR